jgi:hypothetical protein
MNMEEIFNDHHWETSFAQWLMHLIALQPERSKQLPFQFWPDSCVSTFDHQQFAFIPQLRSAVVPTPVGDVDAFATQLQVCAALRYPRPSLSGMCGSSAARIFRLIGRLMESICGDKDMVVGGQTLCSEGRNGSFEN